MQARWLRLTVRDSRTPTTRTQKLSRRLLRNERWSCRLSRRAAMTLRVIRTPMSSDESGILPAAQDLIAERRVPCVAGGNSPELFELAKEVLDEVPPLVELGVDLELLRAAGML